MRSAELKADWETLLEKLTSQFPGDGDLDLDGVLLLVGTQELQMGYVKMKKDVKINVLHVAICILQHEERLFLRLSSSLHSPSVVLVFLQGVKLRQGQGLRHLEIGW